MENISTLSTNYFLLMTSKNDSVQIQNMLNDIRTLEREMAFHAEHVSSLSVIFSFLLDSEVIHTSEPF